MNEAKLMSTPMSSHFRLSKEQSLKTKEKKDHMSKVSYILAIGIGSTEPTNPNIKSSFNNVFLCQVTYI